MRWLGVGRRAACFHSPRERSGLRRPPASWQHRTNSDRAHADGALGLGRQGICRSRSSGRCGLVRRHKLSGLTRRLSGPEQHPRRHPYHSQRCLYRAGACTTQSHHRRRCDCRPHRDPQREGVRRSGRDRRRRADHRVAALFGLVWRKIGLFKVQTCVCEALTLHLRSRHMAAIASSQLPNPRAAENRRVGQPPWRRARLTHR